MSEDSGCVWLGGGEHFGKVPGILWLEMSGERALSSFQA